MLSMESWPIGCWVRLGDCDRNNDVILKGLDRMVSSCEKNDNEY